jgi:hypothetical protein
VPEHKQGKLQLSHRFGRAKLLLSRTAAGHISRKSQEFSCNSRRGT